MNKSSTYLVRWKGQQFGPFTREAIEQKVREHELSLAHEIQTDGKWRSLRGFLNLQAQTQEQERQKMQLKKVQDVLDEKQVELEDMKAELNEIKKRPTLSLRTQPDSPINNSQEPDPPRPQSNNPIDKLKERFRRKS